jgi:hypothetical protein
MKYFEERDYLHLINVNKLWKEEQIRSTFVRLLVLIEYLYENIKVLYWNFKLQNITLNKFHNFELVFFIFYKKLNEKMMSIHFKSNCYNMLKTFNQISN